MGEKRGDPPQRHPDSLSAGPAQPAQPRVCLPACLPACLPVFCLKGCGARASRVRGTARRVKPARSTTRKWMGVGLGMLKEGETTHARVRVPCSAARAAGFDLALRRVGSNNRNNRSARSKSIDRFEAFAMRQTWTMSRTTPERFDRRDRAMSLAGFDDVVDVGAAARSALALAHDAHRKG